MASFVQMGKGWQAQVRRKGVKKYKTFPTKTEAKKWARRIEAELDAASDTGRRSAGKLTLEAVIQDFIAYATRHKPMGRSKAFVLASLQNGPLGPKRMDALTVETIVTWGEGRDCGGVTLAMDLTYLAAVWKFARTRLKLDLPADLVQIAREELRDHGLVGKSRERDRRPTADELARLEKVWNSTLPFDLVRFAIASAMRASEITRLRWADLDGSTILVRDRKDPRVKVGNDQVVPLSPDALAIIQRQPRVGPLIFPFNEKTISSIHPRMCRLAKITDLRFHDYRHEGISRFFEAGLTIPEVAAISGHKDWKQLARYTNLKANDIAAKLARSGGPA